MVFGVRLDHFFQANREEPAIAIVRKSERIKLPCHPGEKTPTYLFESLDYPASDRRMEAFYAEFPVGAPPSQPHRHGSAEFIYVLSGRLSVDVDGQANTLHTGDAVYFDSSVEHSYRSEGKSACTVIVVTAGQ